MDARNTAQRIVAVLAIVVVWTFAVFVVI